MQCAECNQIYNIRTHKEIILAVILGYVVCGKKGKGYTTYDIDCSFKIKIRKYIVRRLVKKRSFYS